MADLSVGDRVKIVDRKHPAFGQYGTVATPPEIKRLFGTLPPGVYITVEMDDMAGHRCGAEPRQVRRVSMS